MWPEVIEVRRDSQGFFPLRVQGGFGLLPFFLKAKGTYAHMCIQLLQKGHMTEIHTDGAALFVSSVLC